MAFSYRNPHLTRRTLVKKLGLMPLLLRAFPLHGESFGFGLSEEMQQAEPSFSFSDARLHPKYPARSPLEDVLRLVTPGTDEYVTEKYAFEIGLVLGRWSHALRTNDLREVKQSLAPTLKASALVPIKETQLRSGVIRSFRREYAKAVVPGIDLFLRTFGTWVGRDTHVDTADFEITSVEEIFSVPLTVRLDVRYSIVASRSDTREQRVGLWQTDWVCDASQQQPGAWKLIRLQASTENVTTITGPGFIDVTREALGSTASYETQMLRGSDEWRTELDGACGIDVYGNNGVAAGDYNNDGFDDLYVCQPAGLPNRLYRNRGDGTFEDVTEAAGVGVLDNTSCALFADFRNSGLQDLLVVCGSGPLLFLNQGNDTFTIKRDAFQFARPPQGTFTHAAIADYDLDGRLDIYFCLYSYYVGLDQYHYPVPYFDARNGPPNFLLHNEGNATFVDRTEATGLNVNNDRYSFACAWGESFANGKPDLYVVNDFGRNNLYRNNGDDTFSEISTKTHVEDVGAGMSACWADYNNDGRPDLYAANMWSAAGRRVSLQKQFHERAPEGIRDLYRRHAQGNALYRNQGDGVFENVSQLAGVEVGRWAWCSDSWDFDHDGFPDLYVTNGYISAPEQVKDDASRSATEKDRVPVRGELDSFFWRQVVSKSPEDPTPSLAYERGWNALNELIRTDNSWSGHEKNVMFANNCDGTFSEVSGAVGMDFLEDGRSFALADLDGDGRLEVVVKNRNASQLRIMHNSMNDLGDSIAFRLKGTNSNRDGIGTAITLEKGELRQTKYLQAGSGFLAQHSKEVFFGLGKVAGIIRATVRWPSGLTQHYSALPPNHRISFEEGSATFSAKAFVAPSAAYAKAGRPETSAARLALRTETGTETWLIDPLKAPAFTLPDLAGNAQQLESLRGGLVLLYFWKTISPTFRDQLRMLEQHRSAFVTAQLSLLAVNVNDADEVTRARAFAEQDRFSFPILFATEEIAGIYNIIYRYLFDRRRDLPVPTSFLVDREGMIVKLYQGPLTMEHLLRDVRSMPSTSAERVRKALPFPGTLHHGEFMRNDFTYGVAMFQHGYLDQAAESFQQVVRAKPDSAEGYYNLGTLSLRRNDFAGARKYLQQTLQLKPNYPEAWNNLGMMAAQESHAEEAIQHFQQSLALRPDYAVALLNLGNVYRRQGNADKAQSCLTRAVDLQPDDPEANYSLGMFYAQQSQLQPASVRLRKAIDLRPDYPEALNNLGVLLVRKQDYSSAEQQFKTCIRLVPSFDESYLNLARLYVLQQDKRKATEVLQDLLRLKPESALGKQGLQALQSMP